MLGFPLLLRSSGKPGCDRKERLPVPDSPETASDHNDTISKIYFKRSSKIKRPEWFKDSSLEQEISKPFMFNLFVEDRAAPRSRHRENPGPGKNQPGVVVLIHIMTRFTVVTMSNWGITGP